MLTRAMCRIGAAKHLRLRKKRKGRNSKRKRAREKVDVSKSTQSVGDRPSKGVE